MQDPGGLQADWTEGWENRTAAKLADRARQKGHGHDNLPNLGKWRYMLYEIEPKLNREGDWEECETRKIVDAAERLLKDL